MKFPFLFNRNKDKVFEQFSANPYHHLLFSRGYLLSEYPFQTTIRDWKVVKIARYWLMYDARIQFEQITCGHHWVALLGTAVDIHYPDMPLNAIVKKLVDLYQKSDEDFYQYLDAVSGRYMVIYGDRNTAWLLQDATGMRSVFYSSEQTVVASHSNLITAYFPVSRNEQVKLEWLSNYNSFYLPANLTPYKNIYYLTPNTKLNLNNMVVERFFPREDLIANTVDNVVDEVSALLEGQLVSLAKQYKLMISLTAGTDSRTTLALSKAIKDKVLFFTYFKSGSDDKDHMKASVLDVDRLVAIEICKNLNLEHKLLNINYDQVSTQDFDAFAQVQQENSFLHHNYLLSKLYLEQLPTDALHIRSTVTGIFKRIFRKTTLLHEDFTPQTMTFCYAKNALKDPMIVQAFESFFHQTKFNELKNYDPYDMFYWEYRLGTWHSSLLLESDIAHDTYVIYNAREIIQKLLSIPVSDQLNATVLKRLVKKHWPVLNYWQENNTQTVDFFDPQFDRNGILLTPFEVVSGSTVDSARTVPVYLKVQEHRAKFFIDINNPKKGDYVEFIKHIPVVPGSGTMLILQLRSPYQNSRVRERLIYKVLVDDAVIAQEDISDWKESNVIQMCWVPDREKVKVSVRVEALTNCELHNWGTAGTILIEKIQVTDFSKALEFSVHATSPFTTLSSSI